MSGLGLNWVGPFQDWEATSGSGEDLPLGRPWLVPSGASDAQLTTDLELVRTRGI